MKIGISTLALLAIVATVGWMNADAGPLDEVNLEPGDKAPSFRLNDQSGSAVGLKDLGKDRIHVYEKTDARVTAEAVDKITGLQAKANLKKRIDAVLA